MQALPLLRLHLPTNNRSLPPGPSCNIKERSADLPFTSVSWIQNDRRNRRPPFLTCRTRIRVMVSCSTPFTSCKRKTAFLRSAPIHTGQCTGPIPAFRITFLLPFRDPKTPLGEYGGPYVDPRNRVNRINPTNEFEGQIHE